MQHFIRHLSFLAGLAICLTAPVSAAADSALDGRDLAQKVHDRSVGDNSAAEAVMILKDADGDERVRDMTLAAMEGETGLRRNFTRFTSPPDIAGTGFLSIEQGGGETEQFLYLPALGRTRRIVTSQKGRSFVNSDFTYEDMQRRPVDDSKHEITGEEKIGGLDCWILETRPLPKAESEYDLIRSWIPKDIYLPVLMELYDKSEKHIKTYTVTKLKRIEDIWTPLDYRMQNLEDGHSTIIRITYIDYNTEAISESFFTKRSLESW